jgi:uncharacterized membrane protein
VLFLAWAAVVFGYPFAAREALARFGVAPCATVLALFATASLLLARRTARRAVGAGLASGLGLVALPAAAALTGDRTPLLFVPAWVYVILAQVFRASLREEGSIVERGVQLLHPWAPDFIRSYCRKLTAGWAVFFGANAAAIAALAAAAPLPWWEAYTSWIQYALMGAISAVEFVVRKAWFRYYYRGGPVDRLLASFFPAEATPEGRRSLEYIRRMREELASAAQPRAQ